MEIANGILLVVLLAVNGTILRYVRNRTQHILERETRIMATLQEVIDAEAATNDSVQAAAARVATDLAALKDQVSALQAQIDAGGGVTAADLDSLKAGLDAIGTDAAAIDPAAVVEPPTVIRGN
jgi:hypothetical protein